MEKEKILTPEVRSLLNTIMFGVRSLEKLPPRETAVSIDDIRAACRRIDDILGEQLRQQRGRPNQRQQTVRPPAPLN